MHGHQNTVYEVEQKKQTMVRQMEHKYPNLLNLLNGWLQLLPGSSKFPLTTHYVQSEVMGQPNAAVVEILMLLGYDKSINTQYGDKNC